MVKSTDQDIPEETKLLFQLSGVVYEGEITSVRTSANGLPLQYYFVGVDQEDGRKSFQGWVRVTELREIRRPSATQRKNPKSKKKLRERKRRGHVAIKCAACRVSRNTSNSNKWQPCRYCGVDLEIVFIDSDNTCTTIIRKR